MARTARMPALTLLWALAATSAAAAQQVLTQPERVITIPKGKSALVVERNPVDRVSVADDKIADPVPVSPTEVLINGKDIGITSVIVWAKTGGVSLYSVEVTADPEIIKRQIDMLGADVHVDVQTSGSTIILSGTVPKPVYARRAVDIARASSANVTVINNIHGPSASQVLLKVRFAEITRTGEESFGSQLNALNLQRLRPGGRGTDWTAETLSDGLVHLFLSGDNTSFEALITALRKKGEYRELAEPSLLAMDGDSASFLAGGRFPFPVVQSSASNAVTVQWQEFGVRLNFRPFITDAGSIRLHIAPEVSSLDFANGLVLNGFRIPTIDTRNAETTVELQPGQHLAIAGLLDNNITKNATKIPLLGDLPIIGTFFRSTTNQQTRRELLVIITPEIVEPSTNAPPVPTGEPGTWKWLRGLRPQDMPGAGAR